MARKCVWQKKKYRFFTYHCKRCVLVSMTLSNEPWSEVVDKIDGVLDELGLGGGVTDPPSEWKPSSTWSVSIVEDGRLQESGTFNVSPVYWKFKKKEHKRKNIKLLPLIDTWLIDSYTAKISELFMSKCQKKHTMHFVELTQILKLSTRCDCRLETFWIADSIIP